MFACITLWFGSVSSAKIRYQFVRFCYKSSFQTNNIDIVNYCRAEFDLRSTVVEKHSKKFVAKIRLCKCYYVNFRNLCHCCYFFLRFCVDFCCSFCSVLSHIVMNKSVYYPNADTTWLTEWRPPSWKSTWCHISAVRGPIWTKFE